MRYVLAIMIALTASPAAAQRACGLRVDMVAKLSSIYGEARQSRALGGPAEMFETFANSSTGTWTLLRSDPTGVACVMASGDGWQKDAAEPEGNPA